MSGQPYRVVGLSELLLELEATDKALAKALRDRLRETGRVVARDVQKRIGGLHPPSPATGRGVRVYVRRAGLVSVEQSKLRTTGKRPDWGVTQMKDAFLPAGEEGEHIIGAQIERDIDAIIAQQH